MNQVKSIKLRNDCYDCYMAQLYNILGYTNIGEQYFMDAPQGAINTLANEVKVNESANSSSRGKLL